MTSVFSFDIFDTCLVRTVARPADLFFILADNMLSACRGANTYGREEVSELAMERVNAEKRAHACRTGEDITIDEIYGQFTDLPAWGISAELMKAEELRLELAAVRPVNAIKKRIQKLRSEGKRVVFISDMYLPFETVKSMLEICGYEVPEGTLYLSNKLGLTKRSGNLYKHVMRIENVAAKNMMHCGDGIESDYLGARKAGVRSELITLTHLNRFEKAMLQVSAHKSWVTSQIAGISRATRLGFSGNESLTGSAEIAASVIAPLLSGFVLWVMRDAAKRGLERLYFVARDGQILHKVAQELSRGMAAPEARYLYGSRQAWYLPSAFNLNRQELEFVLFKGQSSAPRHCLKRLNLTPEDFREPLLRYGFSPDTWDKQLTDDQIESFWQFAEDPQVAPLIMEEIRKARESALAYFEQEELLKDDKWALVDIGWTLRTQGSFKKLMASAGQNHTLGYYLGICKARFSSVSYGQGVGYLLEETEDEMNSEMRSLFQNKGLVDQVFTMADHGSTKGYVINGDKVEPSLSALPKHPKREEFLIAVQSLVTTFARELAEASLLEHEAELRGCARKVTGMLIGKPTRKEAKTLAWAPISDDPNELRSAPLAKPLSPVDLFKIARQVFSRYRNGRKNTTRTVPSLFYKDLSWGFSWLEGSVALSGPWGKVALWGFNTMQYINREKKTLAAKPVAFWQRLTRGIQK